jgi:hypothetical protein
VLYHHGVAHSSKQGPEVGLVNQPRM